jgi:hypothetical protein
MADGQTHTLAVRPENFPKSSTMDNLFLLSHAAQRQRMQVAVCLAYERQAQEAAAFFAQHAVAQMRNAVAGILFADQGVGLLDAATVEAFGMETVARAVRNTAKSRAHVVESRQAEGDFDLSQKVAELAFALAHVVMFRTDRESGRVHLITKRPKSRDRFFILHLRLDHLTNEWLLESFNRISRERAIFEHRTSRWSWTPAACRALANAESAFG